MKATGLKTLLALAAAGVLAAAGAPPAQAQGSAKYTFKLAHGATPDHPVGLAMKKFADLVAEKSQGAAQVELHLAGSLYNERTSLEAVVNGAVDMGGASNANWAPFTRALLFMDLPYVVNDEAAFRNVTHGEVGAAIRKRFQKDGFELLMILDNGGFRDIVNSRHAVKVPSDLKGLKFRTTASPVEIAMFRHWGAIPTSIDWAEVYNALSSGVVDGEFVMPTWLASEKHYEVLKYATQNKAVIGIQTLVMRKDRFDKLPQNIRKVLLDSATEAQEYESKVDAEDSRKAREVAKKLGIVTYTPTDEEMKVWRKTGREVWKQFEDKLDKELFQMVLDSQQKG